jgi:4-hydroxybenzoyl-CoA reductase subunit beta
MLRIAPTFTVATPTTLAEALSLKAAYGDKAALVAGGTDFVPNLKHGLHAPELVISLGGLDELRGLSFERDTIALGALVGIHALATDARVAAVLPSLSQAAGLIAGPQLRRMGTLGGNVCLDTRCVYINQSESWRSALGYCLKKDGDTCHVTVTGKKCVAAASNDTAPVLISLGASVELAGPAGVRTLPLEQFYVHDGAKNTVLAADEILVRVLVPRPSPIRRMAFEKLRMRGAIDFPLLNLALAFDLDAEGRLTAPELVISAIAARPRRVRALPEGPLNGALVERFAQLAYDGTRPLTNINADVEWRREMVPVLVRRAFARAVRPHEVAFAS